MKKFRIAAVLAILVLLLSVQGFAAEDVKLNIYFEDGGKPLPGAEFEMHLIATTDQSGAVKAASPFDQYNVVINAKSDLRAIAATLEGYVLRDNIRPADSVVTSVHGEAAFPSGSAALRQGLYLIPGQRFVYEGVVYDVQPVIIQLPARNGSEQIYHAAMTPKFDSTPEEQVPATVARKALKVWADKGHESKRPKEVTVQLLRDGEVYDTVSLTAANSWRYEWPSLDGDHRWTIVEKKMDDYTVETTREGVTFVVTNTYSAKEPEPSPTPRPSKLPQTGQIWWPVPVLFAAGLVLVIIGLIRRRSA